MAPCALTYLHACAAKCGRGNTYLWRGALIPRTGSMPDELAARLAARLAATAARRCSKRVQGSRATAALSAAGARLAAGLAAAAARRCSKRVRGSRATAALSAAGAVAARRTAGRAAARGAGSSNNDQYRAVGTFQRRGNRTCSCASLGRATGTLAGCSSRRRLFKDSHNAD